MSKIKFILIGCFLWVHGHVHAQIEPAVKESKVRPGYLLLSGGVNLSNFRDFATSPLFYYGTSIYGEIGFLKKDAKREVDLGASYSYGKNTSLVDNNYAVSQVQSFFGYYSRLYQIPSWSDSTWNFKAGGMINLAGNYRYNARLQNNGEGYEGVANILASMKVERDLTRTQHKDKKFLFIKYHQNPRKMNLGFRLNVGLINSSFRNGYVYAGQSSVINDPKIFSGYEFKMFSGFRMSSALDYTIFLNNQNAVRFSYVWDAYKTGGDLDKFEMASHVFKFTLLFKTN